MRIELRAPVQPTEDADKVRQAVLRLFPDATLEALPGEVVGEAPSLERLRELIRSNQIPDSARGAMLSGLARDGMSTSFLLGKQAAASGRAHFGPLRSPLGDLQVTLVGDEEGEVERAIYRTAPDTTVEPEWAEVPHSQRPQA